ncbi:MAG: hypothetical protein ACTTKU_02195 [Eggerthia catenaformis]|uniref:hypothetical protein n=1 Tax=Eggerthia catenaformis TaxID=31973 RepID=UPI003FA13FAB
MLKKDIAYTATVLKYYCNIIFEDHYNHIDDDILKISIYDPKSEIRNYASSLNKNMPEGISLVSAGNKWMDCQKKTIIYYT